MRAWAGPAPLLVVPLLLAVLLLPALALAAAGTPRDEYDGYSTLVIDADRGMVLYQHDATRRWYPASLTKMMTLYLVFAALESHKLSLDEKIKISAHAASQPRSHLGLKAGTTVTVRDMVQAAATISANDAAVALAERIGGSEEEFARLMTTKAHQLAMRYSFFQNATGLPHVGQLTTARDMAIIARRLIHDFPHYYGFFANRAITYKGRTRPTTNKLLLHYAGADGIKTGFTCGSGYNLVTSALRGTRRLIGVVLGGGSGVERNNLMMDLLDRAYTIPTPTKGVLVTELAPTMKDADNRPLFRLGGRNCSGAEARMAQTEGNIATSPPGAVEVDPDNDLETEAEAEAVAPKPDGLPAGWGVLFGIFMDKERAKTAVLHARTLLTGVMDGGQPVLISRHLANRVAWKAMLVGLTQETAGQACHHLRDKDVVCVTVTPSALASNSYQEQ